MPEPIDAEDFAGPHPTCREFVAQLAAWGFTERGEGSRAHRVPRPARRDAARDPVPAGPGRSGPGGQGRPAGRRHARAVLVRAARPRSPRGAVGAARAGAARARTASRRKAASRDSVIALVLAIHAEADRPLGFDQVVELSGNRVTRAQVSAASSALCRDGQLDRIRSGVYQWSGGQRAARRLPAARRRRGPRPAGPLPAGRPAPAPGRHVRGRTVRPALPLRQSR